MRLLQFPLTLQCCKQPFQSILFALPWSIVGRPVEYHQMLEDWLNSMSGMVTGSNTLGASCCHHTCTVVLPAHAICGKQVLSSFLCVQISVVFAMQGRKRPEDYRGGYRGGRGGGGGGGGGYGGGGGGGYRGDRGGGGKQVFTPFTYLVLS